MDDQSIIELFWNRSEDAISEANGKYGRFCYRIAYNILSSPEDAEESVSDALLSAWNAIPPRRPKLLAPFLGRITRNLAIDRLRTRNRDKRGGGEAALALEELEEVVGGSESPSPQPCKKNWQTASTGFWISFPGRSAGCFSCGTGMWSPSQTLRKKQGFPPAR